MDRADVVRMRTYANKLSALTRLDLVVIKRTLMAEYEVGGADLAGAYVNRCVSDMRLNELAGTLEEAGMDGLDALDLLYSARMQGGEQNMEAIAASHVADLREGRPAGRPSR